MNSFGFAKQVLECLFAMDAKRGRLQLLHFKSSLPLYEYTGICNRSALARSGVRGYYTRFRVIISDLTHHSKYSRFLHQFQVPS